MTKLKVFQLYDGYAKYGYWYAVNADHSLKKTFMTLSELYHHLVDHKFLEDVYQVDFHPLDRSNTRVITTDGEWIMAMLTI